MPNYRSLPGLLVVVAVLVVAAPGFAAAQELWVLNEGTLEIAVINPSSNSYITSIDVSDPDGDGTTDVPSGFCFSTLGTDMGTVAFVVQGRWLTMVDVATHSQINAPWDVATLAGLPGLTLAACTGASPVVYDDVVGPVTKTYLHVAANDASGARSVILDQDQLLLPTGAPFVDSDLLDASGTAVSVSAMPRPDGPDYQRAWYTVERASAIVAVQIATTKTLGPWAVTETQVTALPPAPTTNNPLSSRPGCSEVHAMSQGTLGSIVNLEMGLSCSIGGNLSAIELTGPGPNSLTVLALDRASDQLKIFQPDDCGTVESFTVGTMPVSVTTLDKMKWQSAFVVNRDSDNVTRVDSDRTVTTIPVSPPMTPPPPLMPMCVQCPIQAEMSLRNECVADGLRVEKKDLDSDGTADDIELTFQTACPGPPVFRAVCECLDDPLCPCRCDCGNDPDPDCFCPMPDQLGGGGAPENHTIALVPDWPIDEIPWIDLGPTNGFKFEHFNGALPDGSFVYLIVP